MSLAKTEQRKAAEPVRWQTDRGEVALSINYVRQYFCSKATPQEAFAFVQFCRFHRLNPYLREAYLVKYQDSEPAAFIPGYQMWTQRASTRANYRGYQAGIILVREGELEYRQGKFYQQGEAADLVGGWCEVYLSDRDVPIRVEVALHEYMQTTRDGKPNRFWGKMPATMIYKVALAQAHREAYPADYMGMYDQAELADDNELPDEAMIVEGTGSWLDSPELLPVPADSRDDQEN